MPYKGLHYIMKNIYLFLVCFAGYKDATKRARHYESGSKKQKCYWTPEEDEKLRRCMRVLGEGGVRWKEVLELEGLNRDRQSCWTRSKNNLNPETNTEKFSPREEKIIFEQHSLHGNK